MKQQSKQTMGTVVFSIVLSIVGIFMIFNSKTFPKVHSGAGVMTGPGFFPTIIGILMIILGIYSIITNFLLGKNLEKELKQNSYSFFKSHEFFNFLIFIIFIAIYPILISFLGFLIGSFLFCFILMKRLQARWIDAILYSTILVIFTWIVFGKIAFISFPKGIIFR